MTEEISLLARDKLGYLSKSQCKRIVFNPPQLCMHTNRGEYGRLTFAEQQHVRQ